MAHQSILHVCRSKDDLEEMGKMISALKTALRVEDGLLRT